LQKETYMFSQSMRRLFHVGSRGGRGLVVAFATLGLLLVSLTPAAAATLTLTWADASSNEDGFKVERKTGSTGAYGQLASVAANTTGYVDGAVTAGTTYCYRVRAYNSAGDSAYTNEACAAPVSATLYTVAVTKAGAGSGTVASSPSAINCGSTCSASVASGTSVALSATPASGSTFTGWTGACTGTGGCALVVNANKSLTATFATSTAATYTLTLAKSGTGSGTVTSSPTGITCGTDCTQSYSSGTTVTLTAATATGSTFTGWSGACTGTGTCAVSMSAARSVTATFATSTQSAKPSLTSLTANPAGTLRVGTTVTFTARASGGTTPYQYKWWALNGTTWLLLRDWNTSNTFSVTVPTAGTGQIRVWVRNSGTTADSPDASGVLSITVTP